MLLLCVMVAASYTFAVSLVAGQNGRPRTLQAARFGAYGTVALVGTCVLCLAYAFISHDFRLRYVAHYSDRSMSTAYLLTALWGGQDGSLLWWLFLLSMYIFVCVKWLGRKHLELQPYIIATLMAVVLFFCILMAFAANPFSTSVAGARPDGEGLNPLLQNYWMIIHPPCLYMGFVGCTVPFAFGMAALVSGRLDTEWIVASRKFALLAWMFLAVGNTLGMIWAYEELGWGGYWAWDPVENAAFMPLLSASAFLHSVMIQERRGLLKVWNIILVSLTFMMTIFGTFLTRSGAIASVHSFAQSSIGTYFVYFLILTAITIFTLVLYRWPELRDLPISWQLRKAALLTGWTIVLLIVPGCYAISRLPFSQLVRALMIAVLAGAAVYAGLELVFRRIAYGLELRTRRPVMESIWSRELTFLVNNWALLGFMGFVLVATTFPMISEAVWDEKVTVGPPYYNIWVQPIALTIFGLMGCGSLFGWKKTTPHSLRHAFRAPLIALVAGGSLHLAFGRALGFPAIVWNDPIYPGALGQALRAFNAFTPLIAFSLISFNITVIVQEFVLLFRSRRKSGASADTPEVLWYAGFFPGFVYTLITLPPQSRRRYGGYIVHFAICIMMFGFTGKSWTVDRETTLSPNQTYQVEEYTLKYIGPRMEVDNNKRMIFADIEVMKNGSPRGALDPAKFIYKKMPESPTTEVSMMHTLRNDLYLVVGTINPQTKTASLQVHINPLVSWIWFGCLILISGSVLCMWPEMKPEESRVWAFARGTAGIATSIFLGVVIAMMPSVAHAQAGMDDMHSGTIKILNDNERDVFERLRCTCGCPTDRLSTCSCETAEEAREKIRAKLNAGETKDQVILEYTEEFGSASLVVPPNKGAMRAIYAVPLAGILLGGIGLVVLVRKWRGKDDDERKPPRPGKGDAPDSSSDKKDEYDARLDDALRDLDD
ncbi:MAG: cytochrome c-type biogenesis CcmF C-terminal domain-containing protein [Polyangiaceae bacterium]